MRRGEGAIALSLLVLLAAIGAASCGHGQDIDGEWDGGDRVMRLSGARFTIDYKNAEKVRALRGSCAYRGSVLEMRFEEYEDAGGSWLGLDGTDLKGHEERLTLKLDGDKLTTVVAGSGKSYSYTRKPSAQDGQLH
jgi:hypothetical protein